MSGKVDVHDTQRWDFAFSLNRFLGWRQEECAPGGCFMELSIQLAIVFMGKQFMLSVMEYYIPLLWRAVNWVRLTGWRMKVRK